MPKPTGPPNSQTTTTTSPPPWANYSYTPTERNVFAPSAHKDRLLPLWRFRTPALARTSSQEIWAAFLQYEQDDDFVGMDNARKFLQMGMTRAKRYANHKGGRKYGRDGQALEEGEGEKNWEGRKDKEEASQIFREVWEKAKTWEGYMTRKEVFLEGQREWRRVRKADEGRGKKRKRGDMTGEDETAKD